MFGNLNIILICCLQKWSKMGKEIENFKKMFLEMIDNQDNPFHSLVFVRGKPKTGKNVYVGIFSEINAQGAEIIIGDNCDIASFVSINVADSHKKCINLKEEIERKSIIIENNVFIGSHSFIKGGTHLGHHSIVAAGTIVEGIKIPAYSLIYGNPMKVKEGYYKD